MIHVTRYIDGNKIYSQVQLGQNLLHLRICCKNPYQLPNLVDPRHLRLHYYDCKKQEKNEKICFACTNQLVNQIHEVKYGYTSWLGCFAQYFSTLQRQLPQQLNCIR